MDYKENLHKGEVLMMEALKWLGDGDIANFDKCRSQANEFFDSAVAFMKTSDGGKAALYGENRNFGIIMKVIEENLDPKMMGTVDGRCLIADIARTIRGDKVLAAESRAYGAITSPSWTDYPNDYVDSALNGLSVFSPKMIAESNDRLIDVMRRHKLNEMVEISDEDIDLYEAIENAILKRGSLSDVDDFVRARGVLVEYVSAHRGESGSISESECSLNDDERELIESVRNSVDSGKDMFDRAKSEALRAINEVIEIADGGTKGKLSKIYETVESKDFDESTAIGDIAEMIEIKNTIYGEYRSDD